MRKTSICLFVALCACSRMLLASDNAPKNPPAGVDAVAAKTVVKSWQKSADLAKKMKAAGVPNFGKLNDNFFRSGQPTKEGYERLVSEFGIKTVVNLREEFDEKDILPDSLKEHYVYLPVKDEHAPSDDQAQKFMDIVNDSKNWPILVHCHGGEGRAGVMAAIVRYKMDGWDHKAIMKEVSNFRTKHLGFITTPMAGCQQDFIKHFEQSNQPAADSKVASATE